MRRITPNASHAKQRIFALDLIRVVSCFLVMFQHSSEFFYIGPNDSITSVHTAFHIGILSSLDRICVPLFIMISGYLLIPIKLGTPAFLKKHIARIGWPFVFWCVAYAMYYVFYQGDTLGTLCRNILHIPINYGTEIGHLWYIYTLLGLYLLIPVISPWLQICSKRELQGYLGIWLFTTLLPYLHQVFPLILGECTWNPTSTLYYFTGSGGYLVLGYYFKRFGVFSRLQSTLILIVGYIVTTYLFSLRAGTATNVADLELGWSFCTLNVVTMSAGAFSLLRSVTWTPQGAVGRLLINLSKRSYSMYLAHIMILNLYHDLFASVSLPFVVEIPLLTVCTFFTVYIFVDVLSYLPKNQYWLG